MAAVLCAPWGDEMALRTNRSRDQRTTVLSRLREYKTPPFFSLTPQYSGGLRLALGRFGFFLLLNRIIVSQI